MHVIFFPKFQIIYYRIEDERYIDTIIHCVTYFTVDALIFVGTLAQVRVDLISACCSIQAWLTQTLIDICENTNNDLEKLTFSMLNIL